MFIYSNKNPGKSGPYWKGVEAYFFILLTFIVLLTSCAPLAPVSLVSMPTSQSQKTSVVAAIPIPNVGRTQVSRKDHMAMVFVPAGQFEMGGYVDGASDTLPAHKVYLIWDARRR